MIPIQQGTSFRDENYHKHAVFNCPLCGKNFIAQISNVIAGKTKSCCCNLHGQAGSPEHQSWQGMKQRCLDPNYHGYAAYGGRGITVCNRWLLFNNFYADMGARPVGTTLDRIDNNGSYCPENCRWATVSEQARNRRSSRLITYSGETLCLEDWSLRSGIGKTTLSQRLKLGWSVERALTTPNRQGKRLS